MTFYTILHVVEIISHSNSYSCLENANLELYPVNHHQFFLLLQQLLQTIQILYLNIHILVVQEELILSIDKL